MWCIPPQEDARFVAAMEDVLEVYARPYDPAHPVVCLDEAARQLLQETRPPMPAQPGQPPRHDSEYKRNGTCSLFMLFEPLAAKRWLQVREQRTARDYAQVVKWMLEEVHPGAHKVVLVQDNLNTHGPHSLYQAFAPEEARRLIERIEWHYTPRHGSWLNMAELELSVLSRQCLKERMDNLHEMQRHVQAWQSRRNQTATRVQWQFTTQDARGKLHRLYPKLLPG
jgi:hypothetical protein